MTANFMRDFVPYLGMTIVKNRFDNERSFQYTSFNEKRHSLEKRDLIATRFLIAVNRLILEAECNFLEEYNPCTVKRYEVFSLLFYLRTIIVKVLLENVVNYETNYDPNIYDLPNSHQKFCRKTLMCATLKLFDSVDAETERIDFIDIIVSQLSCLLEKLNLESNYEVNSLMQSEYDKYIQLEEEEYGN
jgi:hypothetical protein